MNPETNAVAAAPSPAPDAAPTANPQPPLARREPVEHINHGDRRIDHYAWLREKENPEVIAYLNA